MIIKPNNNNSNNNNKTEMELANGKVEYCERRMNCPSNFWTNNRKNRNHNNNKYTYIICVGIHFVFLHTIFQCEICLRWRSQTWSYTSVLFHLMNNWKLNEYYIENQHKSGQHRSGPAQYFTSISNCRTNNEIYNNK